jgi:chitodextrinase
MRWKVLPWLGIAACLLPAADSAATRDAPWSSILVYTGGMTVCEAGVNYQTNWWTQGNAPATKSGPAGSGQPWTVTGTCDACALAPTTPVTFTAVGTSSVSTSLIWTPSSAPASYAVSENGAKVAGVVGSSTTISGLSPNKSHRFSVAALEAAGVSAPTKPFVVTTAARETSGGPAVFAPYIDMGLVSSENLLTIQRNSQIKVFTLAFVLSPGGCSAAWQGVGSITNDMLPNGRTILSLVQSLRAVGGDVIISFGGANGDEPALHCPDPTSLAAVYQSVINRYKAKALDFDIEGDKVLDQASIQRRNLALVASRVANPGLTISYTVQVLPSGLDDNGVGVLTSAKRDGFNPDVVNVMAMNYGASVDNGGQMGRNALAATSNTALQVKAAGLTSRVGVIPMIGVNDVSPEVFTLADASLLAAFAASNAYIARLSMWSVGRDNGSCAGSAAAISTCSGIAQSPYAFSAIFEGR